MALDVNRLGQCGETMYGHDIKAYAQRISSYGWETVLVEALFPIYGGLA